MTVATKFGSEFLPVLDDHEGHPGSQPYLSATWRRRNGDWVRPRQEFYRKKDDIGLETSLVVQMIRLQALQWWGPGSIRGLGIRFHVTTKMGSAK